MTKKTDFGWLHGFGFSILFQREYNTVSYFFGTRRH